MIFIKIYKKNGQSIDYPFSVGSPVDKGRIYQREGLFGVGRYLDVNMVHTFPCSSFEASPI